MQSQLPGRSQSFLCVSCNTFPPIIFIAHSFFVTNTLRKIHKARNFLKQNIAITRIWKGESYTTEDSRLSSDFLVIE